MIFLELIMLATLSCLATLFAYSEDSILRRCGVLLWLLIFTWSYTIVEAIIY